MKFFNLIILTLAAFILVIAVLVFGGFLPGFDRDPGAQAVRLEMWGPWSNDSEMRNFISELNREYEVLFNLTYVSHSPDVLVENYLSALARGRAPDLIFIDQDFLLRYDDTLAPYPLENISERVFRDNFAETGNVFWSQNGALALPVGVDPLVMYYNKDLYTNAGLTIPPQNWTNFLLASRALTQTDAENRIEISGAAMGEFSNIDRAKDILSMLLIQGGSPIIDRQAGDRLVPVLDRDLGQPIPPAEAAVNFYTQFVDPRRNTFSWNRSQPEARTAFQTGRLGHYFGLASERRVISNLNPNLNFDVAVVPQTDASNRRTYARVSGLSVVAGSNNPGVAWQAGNIIAFGYADRLSEITGLAPASNVLLGRGHPDAFRDIFYRSAIISRSWLDPDPDRTEGIFGRMINSVNGRHLTTSEAVIRANRELLQALSR